MHTERAGERGTLLAFLAIALVPVIAAGALCIDGGLMLTARTQLQAAADAAALAAMGTMRDGGSFSQARVQAVTYALSHDAAQQNVQLDGNADVTFGTFDHSTRAFTPGVRFGNPAIQVVARRSGSAPGGPINLLWSNLLGRTTADVSAVAVASIRRRDLVIVQDRTTSFRDSFPAAQEGDRALIRAMSDQGFPGDRIGLVTFARDVTEEEPLTQLNAGGAAQLATSVDNFGLCPPGNRIRRGGPCYGTDTAIGIREGIDMLQTQSIGGDAERVIVVVSDGLPCYLELGGQRAVTAGQVEAVRAANEAGAAGISIFVVTLAQPPGGGACLGGDVSFNESLARGFGGAVSTTNEDELDDFLAQIVRQMPFHLVK